jgi:putative oxidoreductase
VDAMAKNTLVPLLLRIGLAAVFIYHGAEKVQLGGGANWHPDPDFPTYQQLAVAWGELVGGIAVAVGLLTRLAALGLAAIMVGAIITIHGPNGFSLADGGFEYNFVLLIICLSLILMGAGTLSVDRFFSLKRRT